MIKDRNYQIMFFERNLNVGDKTSHIEPNGRGIVSYAEDYADPRYLYRRNDICLINTGDGQRVVYPGKDGNPHGDGWELLQESDKEICRIINRAMCAVASIYPEYAKAYRLD